MSNAILLVNETRNRPKYAKGCLQPFDGDRLPGSQPSANALLGEK